MDALPAFEASDLDGQIVTHTSVAEMAPVLLVLLRGLA